MPKVTPLVGGMKSKPGAIDHTVCGTFSEISLSFGGDFLLFCPEGLPRGTQNCGACSLSSGLRSAPPTLGRPFHFWVW